MLARVATRSARLNSASLRAIVVSSQLRNYAKSNKPQRTVSPKLPTTLPSENRTGANLQRARQANATEGATGAAVASGSSDKSGASDYSILQDEFQTEARGQDNTSPLSDGKGPSPATRQPFSTSSHPEYSRLQDEFETSPASDQNTTPQDTSPSAINPAEARKNEELSSPPLPDLTKGIPSTLDAELAEARARSNAEPSALDITEDGTRLSSAGGRGGRQMPASAYITSAERRRNSLMNWMFGGMLLLCLTGPIYLGRNWESEEEEKNHPDVPSGWGLSLFYNRAKTRLADMLDYYNEPTFPKLLPDVDPAWGERPYTLVLSLEDLLVHSEWTREHGWRTAKRPGVDYFLRYLSQYYELVVFTSVSSMIADPVIKKLDPYRIIMWPLFREATRYKNGEYIKDLSYLNRPLSRTILIDTVPAHAQLQPTNAIILPKWTGATNDKTLISLIPFLESVATMSTPDIRPVIASFTSSANIPAEYAAREAAARKRFEATLAAERAKRPRKSAVGFLGNALGIKGGGMMMMEGEQSLSEGLEQGKMLQDQIRERGQRQYAMLEKEIRENGEKLLKEMAAEEAKAMEEQMKGFKAGLTGWFGGSGKTA